MVSVNLFHHIRLFLKKKKIWKELDLVRKRTAAGISK